MAEVHTTGVVNCDCDFLPCRHNPNYTRLTDIQTFVRADQPRTPLLEVNSETLDKVKAIIASEPVRAAGYRMKVLLIDSEKSLSAGEAELAPTLAKSKFIMKSDKQKEREDRGTDTALIVDIGLAAYSHKIQMGDQPWNKVGQVIKMIRYTGHAYEEPPGSGKRYALINDEDVLGYYEKLVEA